MAQKEGGKKCERHHQDERVLPKALVELKRGIAARRNRRSLISAIRSADHGISTTETMQHKLALVASKMFRVNIDDYRAALKARQRHS